MEKEKLPKVVLSDLEIKSIVQRLAEEIERDYLGRPLVVLGVLNGAFIFMADLLRRLKLDLSCDFIKVQSYLSDGTSGEIKLILDISRDIRNQDVLVVEDIIDGGKTARFLYKHLKGKGAKSVAFCALLGKESTPQDIKINYLGKVMGNDYVYGYGMDIDGRKRHLPWIEIQTS